MANWLELARREFQKTPDRPAAIADVRVLSAATAAIHPGVCEKLEASIGSNGCTQSMHIPEIEGAAEPRPSLPVDLYAILAEACKGVPGIDAATFRALLSPEDVEDIEGGHIRVETLNAYARSFAEGIRTGRI